MLSLGSNLGDRLGNLRAALSTLHSHPRLAVRSVSPVYRTEPLTERRQDDFFNCAIELRTELTPEELLHVCMDIEVKLGRKRPGRKHSPRPIDLDIVFFGNRTVATANLKIPHPRYGERKFVLVPLADIAPDFVCPDTGLTVNEALEVCGDGSRVELVREAEMV